MVARLATIDDISLERAAQLTNKSNQDRSPLSLWEMGRG
jgi:hypothetical protein